ncbi:hypothetical protein ACFL1H_06615 [Nanoarchaeota archaeon]
MCVSEKSLDEKMEKTGIAQVIEVDKIYQKRLDKKCTEFIDYMKTQEGVLCCGAEGIDKQLYDMWIKHETKDDKLKNDVWQHYLNYDISEAKIDTVKNIWFG